MTEHDMSSFWHWWIIALTLLNIAGMVWLLHWTRKRRPGEVAQGQQTGHVWDGDLSEYNNPLPRWWLWMFYLTIAFALAYLVLYPGLGRFAGVLGWSSVGQFEAEVSRAEERFGPLFAAYAERPIPELATDAQALVTGQRLYLNYCSTCHGVDAQGAPGFPNLANGMWQWGATPEAIKVSILDGRQGIMPAMGMALGDAGTLQVAHYVLSLSGRTDADHELATQGQAGFQMMCAACHGREGEGISALGAPDLRQNVWLYGGSIGAIQKTINEGRHGIMPPFRDFLGEDRVHVLAAYIYSLNP